MVFIGYHASHEQFAPEELLTFAQAAEQAGFDAVMSSDHIRPWSHAQGQSGFVWSWLGAAMQATSIPFGTLCIPGGWRYHPAIVAQAAATLDRLFPGRLRWIAPGSGEALNETIVGQPWPDKAERNARLGIGVEMMRRLWAGETITAAAPIRSENAKLYTLPVRPPPLLVPALTPETAAWAASWADGMITMNQAPEKVRAIVESYRAAGGRGPLALQVHLSFEDTPAEARKNAYDQWRSNALPVQQTQSLRTPTDFERATEDVKPDDMDAYVRISSEPGEHLAWIRDDISAGFDEIYLHNVGRNQRGFIDVFGEQVLPQLRENAVGGGQ